MSALACRVAVLGLASAGALLAAAGAGHAQDPGEVRVGITYQPGYVPALVALPAETSGAALAELATRIDTILRTDLEYSDRFEMLEPPAGMPDGEGVNYGLWNQFGAVWLVTAHLTGTASAPILRVSLHDVVYGNLTNVQAFSLPDSEAEGFRMAVHRVSDEVVRWATGDPGIAATRVVFRRRASDGSYAVHQVDSDGHGLRRLTSEPGVVYSPTLSPDGRRLLYQVRDADGATVIVERNLATGRRRTVAGRDERPITPTYAPDGGIAYAAWLGDGYEIVAAGRGRITRTVGGDALNPSYAPDGRRIAFEAAPLGQQQVYVQAVEGGRPLLISRYVRGERGSAASPTWSPRGDRIAYMAWVDGQWQIFAVNPDGTERRVLTSRGRNEDPSWAPDGRHIVFASTQRTGRGLWILDTVTGRTRILTSGQVDELPAWSAPLPAEP